MNESRSAFTRRSFLSRLAAGSTAAVVANMSSPTNILAANDVPDQKALLPHFVAGSLLQVASDRLLLHTPGYNPGAVTVLLTTQTEICRGSCDATWDMLKLGDRIEASTYDGPNGVRIARWVNANMVAGWGTVSAINGNVFTVAPLKSSTVGRVLTVYPYTTIHMMDGSSTGQASILSVGDAVHYVGTADDPNPFVRDVMAMTIHQFKMDDNA